MQLLASWKDSLTIFKPANLKLFFLVTLKALGDTYKVWLEYWGWLVFAVMLANCKVARVSTLFFLFNGPFNIFTIASANFIKWLLILALIINPLILLYYSTLVLSARPSIALKNFAYYGGYLKHVVYGAVWFVLLALLWKLWLIMPISLVPFGNWATARFGLGQPWGGGLVGAILSVLFYLVYFMVVSMTTLFFMLFLFDSEGTVRDVFSSVWRAIKMLIFNLPFCLIMGIIIAMLYQILVVLPSFLLEKLTPEIDWSIGCEHLLFLPIFICIMTNFYVKRLHDQFSVYYK